MLDIFKINKNKDLNDYDFMILNYIMMKYNNINTFPKIAISELAYFIGKDMHYVLHRLSLLEKKKLIIIERDSKTPLYPRFYPYNEKYKKAISYRKK